MSSAFSNGDAGRFTLAISGEGAIAVGVAELPEPTSPGLATVALCGLAAARRRRPA